MFVLTYHYDETPQVVGVFTTAEKAKKYVEQITTFKNIQWGGHDGADEIWGSTGGAITIIIAPIAFLDSVVKEKD